MILNQTPPNGAKRPPFDHVLLANVLSSLGVASSDCPLVLPTAVRRGIDSIYRLQHVFFFFFDYFLLLFRFFFTALTALRRYWQDN